MTPTVIFSLVSMVVFSLADLRYRVVSGAAVFFGGAVLLSAPEDPLWVSLVVLAVGWGLLRWPTVLIVPMLFYPSIWVVCLMGAGVRRGVVGDADLLVLAGLACLFGWSAAVFVLMGVEVWRRFWRKHRNHPVPALPGMLIGLIAYLLWGIISS